MKNDGQTTGTAQYIISALSFIPVFGLCFGIVTIVWAALTKSKRRWLLIVLGLTGILVTICPLGLVYYKASIEHDGALDQLSDALAASELNSLVAAIELYKLQYGFFPNSLDQLVEASGKYSSLSIIDPTQREASQARDSFYYQRIGLDHYYIRSIGTDRKPFTADDVVPSVPNPSGKLGLLIEQPSG